MEVFLIRHAEAETPRIQPGDPDCLRLLDEYGSGDYQGGLTDRGRRQAALLGGFLRQTGVPLVVSSPTRRALETAETAARQAGGLGVTIAPEFQEIRIGFLRPEEKPRLARRMRAALAVNQAYSRLTGSPLFLPVALYFMKLYVSGWLAGTTEDGEPPAAAAERLRRALTRAAEFARSATPSKVAVVTHGYAIYYLANHLVAPRRKLLSILRRPFVRNVSVTHFVWTEGHWKLECYAEPIGQEATFGIAGG